MSSWYTAHLAAAVLELRRRELQQLRAHKNPIPRLCGSRFAHGSVMASVAMTYMAHSLLKQVRAASDLPETVSAVVPLRGDRGERREGGRRSADLMYF